MKEKPFLTIASVILAALVMSGCSAPITPAPVESTRVSATPSPTQTVPTQTITRAAPPAATPTLTHTATPAAATPTAPSSISASSAQTITRADDGRTISLRVGESFLLKLGPDFDWSVTVADPSILSRVVNLAVVQGAQGVYAAKKTGETTLTATGVIVCAPLKFCPSLEVSFKLHVVVQ